MSYYAEGKQEVIIEKKNSRDIFISKTTISVKQWSGKNAIVLTGDKDKVLIHLDDENLLQLKKQIEDQIERNKGLKAFIALGSK